MSQDAKIESINNHKVRSGNNKKLSLRMGKITSVYHNENKVDIEWILPARGGTSSIELTKPYVGFNSGIHFIPEVGSLVTVGFIEDQTVLLSYFTPSSFSNMQVGIQNKQGDTTRIRTLNPGEISINSVQDSEIYIHDKMELRDRFGDDIVIDPTDGSISLDSLQLYINNEAGEMVMGMVKRDGVIITDDGKPVRSTSGGNALTEFRVTVSKLADNTINSSEVVNETIAELTLGTVVDADGKTTKNQKGNKIVCEINFASGALIQVDDKGNINMNEGNMNKATDSSPSPVDYTGPKFVNTSQQRAAREGDRITIPITAGQTDLDHPQLNQKATQNLTNMTQIAPMFLVYGIPATFIPSSPNTKLVGEITEGSDSVFIGSLDKSAEQQEISKNQ